MSYLAITGLVIAAWLVIGIVYLMCRRLGAKEIGNLLAMIAFNFSWPVVLIALILVWLSWPYWMYLYLFPRVTPPLTPEEQEARRKQIEETNAKYEAMDLFFREEMKKSRAELAEDQVREEQAKRIAESWLNKRKGQS